MDYNRIIGSIFVLSIFIMSSFGKIMDKSGTLTSINSKNMPLPQLAYLFAVFSQLIGIIIILLNVFNIYSNKKLLLFGKLSIITFTILATYYFHNIFTSKNQEISFLKNLGLIGGILLI
jgi:putative oxidoreductase